MIIEFCTISPNPIYLHWSRSTLHLPCASGRQCLCWSSTDKDPLCHKNVLQVTFQNWQLTSRPVEKETKEKSHNLRHQATRQLCNASSVPLTQMAWPGTLLCTSVLAAISRLTQQNLQGTQEKKEKRVISVQKPTKKLKLSPSPAQDHCMTASMCWKLDLLVWKTAHRFGDALKVSNKTHFLLEYTLIL